MKKLLFASLLCFVLSGCAELEIELNGDHIFKVMQTVPGKGALAHRCDETIGTSCVGLLVMLDSKVDAMMYDGKTIKVNHPKIVGTYEYETVKHVQKVVPVVVDEE